MEYFVQLLIDGTLLGGIYVLMAVGMSLSFGVTRIINFAHGEAVMMGAYGAFWVMHLLGIDPLIALLPLMLLGGACGFLLFRAADRRVMTAPPENQILLTFGLALVLQNLALIFWTGDQRSADPPYAYTSILFQDLVIPGGRLIGCGIAAVLVGGLLLWLKFGEVGRATRALAEERQAAVLMGIDVPFVYALAFGISTALAVAAGGILSFLLAITPFMGMDIVIKGFAIIVLGGLGNVWGSVIGAFLLAFAETGVAYYVPDGNGWSEAVPFAVLFLVLILRPRGIIGQAVME